MSLYTRYLVCYDITDNKTRTRFADFLKDIGLISLQKSVFVGELNKAEFNSMVRYAKENLNKETDKAFWLKTNLDEKTVSAGIGYDNFYWIKQDGNFVI